MAGESAGSGQVHGPIWQLDDQNAHYRIATGLTPQARNVWSVAFSSVLRRSSGQQAPGGVDIPIAAELSSAALG